MTNSVRNNICMILIFWMCIMVPQAVFSQNSAAQVSSTPISPTPFYKDGRVNLKPGRVSAPEFLAVLSNASGVYVYVVEDLSDKKIELSFSGSVKLESVLSELLRGYSYAVIYSKNPEAFALFRQDVFTRNNIPPNISTAAYSGFSSGRSLQKSRRNQSGGLGYHPAPGSSGSTFTQQQSVQRSETQTGSAYYGAAATAGNEGSASSSGSTASASTSSSSSSSQSSTDSSYNSALAQVAAGSGAQDSRALKSALEYRIQRLESYISSGQAQRDYDAWSAVKDPSYVYNPWDDLARKKAQLAAY